ncbi:13292_t:CDS:2 [Entrophospora sp. SA101]|nr:13292_t:CDS:2 [Entrophospora sp. SA101]
MSSNNPNNTNNSSAQAKESEAKKKRAGPKRRKVTHACVYCRRSHMTCDEGRPCQRCIKRNIGHLCHDEPKGTQNLQKIQNPPVHVVQPNLLTMSAATSNGMNQNTYSNIAMQNFPHTTEYSQFPLTFASEDMGHEFTVLTDFLENINGNRHNLHDPVRSSLDNTTKFFLTAADPSDGTSEDRLTQVINAKFQAGLLKPYNYVNGYTRLQKYMEKNMSNLNRMRIGNSLCTFRPSFRRIAQSLTDIDLILVEEGFERLLLDYDRVFSSMGIPACLWRRTGEIYKGNKEFASLVGVPFEMLKEGRLCIYEVMK